MLCRTLINLYGKNNTTAVQRLLPKSFCILNAPANEKASEVLEYNSKECDQILNIINNTDAENLLSNYKISNANVKKLQLWKDTRGEFQNLQDLMNVNGLSKKTLQTLCKKLLGKATIRAKKPKISVQQFLTPIMSTNHRHLLRSCVAVRIGVLSISWARIELPKTKTTSDPCVLTDWQHHSIKEGKLFFGDLVEHCIYYDSLIPEADCYILESPQVAQVNNNPGSPAQKNINLQKAQFTAMISFALTARRNLLEGKGEQQPFEAWKSKSTEQLKPANIKMPNVFYLRYNLSARLYNTLVGQERISVEQKIFQIMGTKKYDPQASPELDLSTNVKTTSAPSKNYAQQCGKVDFPLELRSVFCDGDRFQREFLGQALLLNLAFLRLVVFQDEESIAKVKRNPNNEVNNKI